MSNHVDRYNPPDFSTGLYVHLKTGRHYQALALLIDASTDAWAVLYADQYAGAIQFTRTLKDFNAKFKKL